MTGVPQAIASAITSPNGSGQSIGNSNAYALPRNSSFSSSSISPTNSTRELLSNGAISDSRIILVYSIDFRCNFEWHSDLLRNFDRAVHSFLWRNTSQKSQITPGFWMESVDVDGQAVINRCLPVCPRQRLPLSVRCRTHPHR